MLNFARSLAAVSIALMSSAATSAFAQSPVTFVSGNGTDAGNCGAPASPCRTFQYAHGLTKPGGEIKALDPANYFFVTINKSINITGVDGAGVIRGTVGDAITISAGANAVVTLSNLTIDGVNGTAANGVKLNSAGRLTIRNCTVRNFSFAGIRLEPTTALTFLIADAVVTENIYGVYAASIGAVSAKGVLNNVSAIKNAVGVAIVAPDGAMEVTAVNNVASASASGFDVGRGAILRLSHSTITQNSRGVSILGGAVRSAGNNLIDGNTTADVSGTMTSVGTQ